MSINVEYVYNKSLSYDEFMKETNFDNDTIFCKISNEDLNNTTTQYIIGENIDATSGSGFYFETNDNISDYGTYFVTLSLCKDAHFYIDSKQKKYKTNKFVINKCELLQPHHVNKMTDCHRMIKHMKPQFQTYEFCMNVININPSLFSRIRKDLQTTEMCDIILKKMIGHKNFSWWLGSNFIGFIRKDLLTIEFCTKIMTHEPDTFKYFPENLQTHKMCIDAILNDKTNFRYVRQDLQTYDMCIMAIFDCEENFQFVRQNLQTYEMCILLLKKYKHNTKLYRYINPDIRNRIDNENAIRTSIYVFNALLILINFFIFLYQLV